MAQKERLKITAPQAGIVSNLNPQIHEGRMVTMITPLLRLSDPEHYRLIAFAPELDAQRLIGQNSTVFIPDDPALKTLHAQITHQAPTARATLEEAELTSVYGGKIATYPDTEKGLIPVSPVYEIRADLVDDRYKGGRTIGGVAKIKGPRESYAQRIGRQILRVLIREGDF